MKSFYSLVILLILVHFVSSFKLFTKRYNLHIHHMNKQSDDYNIEDLFNDNNSLLSSDIDDSIFESMSFESAINNICYDDFDEEYDDIYTIFGRKSVPLQNLLMDLKKYNYKAIFVDTSIFNHQELVAMRYNFKTKCIIHNNDEIIGGIFEMYHILYNDYPDMNVFQ
jgi:hypothetical protein